MDYCGIDLHAEYSQVCILDEDGEVMETSRVRTSRKALERFFCRDRMRVALEAGGSSPWVSRLLGSLGHEVVVCSPRRVRLIAESSLKNDKVDAEVLARLVRLDPEFLKPIKHRSEQAQRLRGNLKVRSAMVEARTKWINTIRGLLRSFGYNVSGKVAHTFVERVDLMKLPDDLRRLSRPCSSSSIFLPERSNVATSTWRRWSKSCQRSSICVRSLESERWSRPTSCSPSTTQVVSRTVEMSPPSSG